MKITKKILIGIVCLIILFAIVSCDNQNGNKKEENVLGMVDNPSNNVVLSETPDSPVSTEHDDYDGQIVKIGRSNVFPPVLLTNGNTNVVPHFVMYSGEIFSEFFNGMMSVRGDPINYDETLPLLPEINVEEDWYINANGDNIVRSVTFYTIDDNSSEKIAYINDVIAPFGEKTPVKDLNNQCKDSGSYLVEIKVQVKGEFISETDKNESFLFSCLFKVIVT